MPKHLSEQPVRRLTLDDLVACADLSEDRGWPREEHKWGLLLTAGTVFGIDDPSEKGLVASCVVTSYGSGLSAIGMMLVAGRHARQGVGRRLMEYVMERAAGTPLTLYATPFGRPLYEQLGFTTAGGAEMVMGRLATDAVSGAGGRATVRPAAADDLQAVLRLDNEVFGVDRTHMIARLPAFADQFRVSEEDGVLTGYTAAWPNGETLVVGPLVARDTATAKALVSSVAAATDRPLRTDVDFRHEELLSWLKAAGLKTVSQNTVMVHGTGRPPGDWNRRFAPLTLATG
jgi:GNAT superfamily N-acetyltransferase